jgi:OPA family sugar phosphate sensor protein UhpC-like MFS transporter
MSPSARIFAITWVAYAGYYFCRKNFTVLMPFLQEMGHTKDQLANDIFVYSLLYSIGQFSLGVAADKFGARLTVTVGMIVSALSSVAMTWFHSPTDILMLQAVNGIAQACGWSGLLKIMTAWYPPANRGVVMGWWSTNYALGAFVATAFATFAATGPWMVSLGWQRGAWMPAVVLASLALLFCLIVRNAPPGYVDSAPAKPVAQKVPLLEVAANPEIQRIAAAYFCMKLLRYSFLFWLPLYLTERLQFAKSDAGYATSLYELFGFLGVVACGYVSEKIFQSRRFPVGSGALFLLAPMYLLPLCVPLTGNWIVLPAIALIGMLTLGPDTLMAGAAVQDSCRASIAASGAGFVNGVGSVGQLLSPYVVAFVVQRFGWDPLFVLFLLLAVAGGLVLATRWTFAPEGLREPIPAN